MSPQAGQILQEQVVPRLRSAIPRAVRCVGAEDPEELIQDGTAIAAKMLHNAEAAGKKVTPGNIAYYTIAPSFCLLKSPGDVTLIDGDAFERKNLNRQLFDAGQIGMNKAQALAGKYGCRFLPEWFARGKIGHGRNDWLLCLVDNHRTRLETLEVCDDYGCQAIIAANEMHSSEAYYYRRAWKGTARDPRVYYPEINTDHSGDPRAAAIGCTGEVQANNRQLVSANLMAAALAEHLYVLWHLKAPRLDRETVALLPYKFAANLSQLETCRWKGANE